MGMRPGVEWPWEVSYLSEQVGYDDGNGSVKIERWPENENRARFKEILLARENLCKKMNRKG